MYGRRSGYVDFDADRDMIPERVRLIYDQHRSNIEIIADEYIALSRNPLNRVRNGQEVLLTE